MCTLEIAGNLVNSQKCLLPYCRVRGVTKTLAKCWQQVCTYQVHLLIIYFNQQSASLERKNKYVIIHNQYRHTTTGNQYTQQCTQELPKTAKESLTSLDQLQNTMACVSIIWMITQHWYICIGKRLGSEALRDIHEAV